LLRVEARHHTTTRASWVMAVIHCHRPDIYYCSKSSVCPVPSAQRGMVIQASYRLFNCDRCHRQVRICSHCDKGNRYCSPQCSYQARRDSLRRAGASYQQTDQGRINHAARQQNYLIKKRRISVPANHLWTYPLNIPREAKVMGFQRHSETQVAIMGTP
jgi:hypothetical protein